MKLRRIVSCMMALLLVCSLPLAAFAEEYDLAQGSVTVNATESGQTVTHGSNAAVPDSAPVITQSNSSTPTTNTVTINADAGATANVTLSGVNIDTSGAAVEIKGNGDVVIELDGSNTVQSGDDHAGVEKNTIAAADNDPGSGNGNLTITDENGTDGSLNATGGDWGSGIGGGDWGSGSDITITGNAEVTAQGGNGASGIGGGSGGSGSNITITGSAEVTAKGGVDSGSGIGGGSAGSGSDITITGSAEVTATGGKYGAGIGGGENGSGSNITIKGSAVVTAKGGVSGSGIGGGYSGNKNGTGSNITVSEDAQVKAQGGNAGQRGPNKYGAGAAIGDGGNWSGHNPADINGEEKTPNTNALNEGWIATYAPGTTNLDTATPDSLTYKGASNVTGAQPIAKQEPTCTEDGHRAGFTVGSTQVGGQTLPATGHSFTNYISDKNATYEADGTKTAKCDHCDATHTIPDPGSKLVREAPLYRVIGQDGKALACEKAQSSGVLTITVDADFATLTGSASGLKTLKAQGVETIVFVTTGATSTFALAELLAQVPSGSTYALTHVGSTVTLTLSSGMDISSILK